MDADHVLEQLGANLRRQRLAQKLSQEELGGLSGIHRNYIGAIERGEKNITVQKLVALCEALDCDSADLLNGIC